MFRLNPNLFDDLLLFDSRDLDKIDVFIKMFRRKVLKYCLEVNIKLGNLSIYCCLS